MRAQTNAFIRRAKIARKLRRDATDAERRLWRHLRLRQLDGCKFRRQHPLGDYVVDFVCLERRLVVEVDGGQHAANARDERRDLDLRRRGFTVLRFWNTEILRDEESALVRIFDALHDGAAERRRARAPARTRSRTPEMIDHIGITVADFDRSLRFYGAALAPLGYGVVMEVTPEMTGTGARHAGFGKDGKPDFWIGMGGKPTRDGLHLAFAAADRAAVDAFHAAALAAGARDNGAPGLRLHYHPNYYGAFVIDPDGHNIEAVCHRPA